ncbi:MAG TPA: hypothetical protein VG347_03595 [Verrucomicrobiae bacterium]|nr:hypothetical protein [Verrucomicrobiae bacterium]
MKIIEIDGRQEMVWRGRAVSSLRTAGVFPFCGGDWGEAVRTETSAAGEMVREYRLELLLTEGVLVCGTNMAVEVTAVTSIDTVAGTVRMESGAVVVAKISRRALLAEEERFVQSERLIKALHHTEGAEKGQATKTMSKRMTKSGVCEVCGWTHDAGFARIEMPGRAVIELHGAMAQIVALVHAAQADGVGPVSTKDERLLKICGGYRHPCKVFDDLKRREVYRVLFDTRRRGWLGLKSKHC